MLNAEKHAEEDQKNKADYVLYKRTSDGQYVPVSIDVENSRAIRPIIALFIYNDILKKSFIFEKRNKPKIIDTLSYDAMDVDPSNFIWDGWPEGIFHLLDMDEPERWKLTSERI